MEAALSMGWPIATGVIEGACRYLVKDRLATAGARWSVGDPLWRTFDAARKALRCRRPVAQRTQMPSATAR
jgi:hypothetical protein